MASQKQIEANRKNASRSTGPKSAEGRARVARNALKHGLAGHGVVFPDEMAEQIQERKEFFWTSFKPDGPSQQWLYERICVESVRADVCLHRMIALRDEEATRAAESWDDDRALEAEERGASIGRRPELVQPKLLQSRHGALWLLAQWEELQRHRDVQGEWTEAASERAMDLLGLPVDGRVGAWEALTGLEGNGGVDGLIRDEVDALRRRLEGYLEARDDRARCDAEAGLGPDGPEVRRVSRYEAEVLRRLRAWMRELRRLQAPDRAARARDARSKDTPREPSALESIRLQQAARPSNPPIADPDRPVRAARPLAPGHAAATADPSRSAASAPERTSPRASALNRHERRTLAARERRDRRS